MLHSQCVAVSELDINICPQHGQVNDSLEIYMYMQVCIQAKWPSGRSLSRFRSTKRLHVGIFALPLDGMLVHPRVTPTIKFAGTHWCTWVKRGTVRVMCLAQEHITVCPARAQTPSTCTKVKCTNHEASVTPTNCTVHLILPCIWNCLRNNNYVLQSATYISGNSLARVLSSRSGYSDKQQISFKFLCNRFPVKYSDRLVTTTALKVLNFQFLNVLWSSYNLWHLQ